MGGDLESSVSVVSPRLVMAPTRELACQIQLLGCSPLKGLFCAATASEFWSIYFRGIQGGDVQSIVIICGSQENALVMTNKDLVDLLLPGPLNPLGCFGKSTLFMEKNRSN